MATRPERKLTYADYVRFPNDGRRWELIDGEAFMVPSPSWRHQDLVGRIYRQIAGYLDRHGGGRVVMAPLDVVLSEVEGAIVQPDVVFVSDAEAQVITEKGVFGVPTWVIEVVCDPVRDKKVKRDLYTRFGVPEYWVLDGELGLLEIHRPGQAAVLLGSRGRPSPQSLPGFELDLDSVLAD